MANPRIEEVDDEVADDPEEMDLDAFDFARPGQQSLGQSTAQATPPPQMSPDMMQQLLESGLQQGGTGSTQVPQIPRQMSDKERERLQREQQEASKHFQCIYPVYFDSTRSREEGRRVRKEDAVPNPLAREIVEALSQIGQKHNLPLKIVLEPAKCHPKDWANPGRVKVLIKENAKPINSTIHNSRCLPTQGLSRHVASGPTQVPSSVS